MFEPESTPESAAPQPLTARQLTARAKAKKTNSTAVMICIVLCIVLAVISAVLPSGVSTPWMFASYATGYIGVLWALAGLWAHFLGPNAPK